MIARQGCGHVSHPFLNEQACLVNQNAVCYTDLLKHVCAYVLEAWNHQLAPGEPLPCLPLWLAENLAIPLDLEASYEQTCRDLRIA